MPARPLRRLVAVLVCSACLLLPQAASPVPGSEATRGERGSGPPTWSAGRAAANADLPRPSGIHWSDVPNSLWAHTAIDFVGAANDWMRDRKAAEDGTYAFEPDRLESRKLFARALFRAFGSDARTGSEADVHGSARDRPLLPLRERERDRGVDAGRRHGRVPSDRPGDDARGPSRARPGDRHGRSRGGRRRPASAGRDRDRDAEGLRHAPDRDADRPALQPQRRIARRRSRPTPASSGGGLVAVPRRDRTVVDARLALRVREHDPAEPHQEDAIGPGLRDRVRRLPVRVGRRLVPAGAERATAAGTSRSAGSTARASRGG